MRFRSDEERARFSALADKYINNERVREMDSFIQHGRTTTLSHCTAVAKEAFLLNERLHAHADEQALVRVALLHDFYLYDWHDSSGGHLLHGFRHPRTAAGNAKRYFDLPETELRAIRTHMWPFTPFAVPTSRVAWLVCAADKICALRETINRK